MVRQTDDSAPREKLMRRLLSVLDETVRECTTPVDPWELVLPFGPVIGAVAQMSSNPQQFLLRHYIQTEQLLHDTLTTGGLLDALVTGVAALLSEITEDMPEEGRAELRRDVAGRIAGGTR